MDRHFLISAMTNFFLGCKLIFIISEILTTVKFSNCLGNAIREIFIIASQSAKSRKRSFISFYPPFAWLYFNFLAWAWAAIYQIQVWTKSGSFKRLKYPTAAILLYCVLICSQLSAVSYSIIHIITLLTYVVRYNSIYQFTTVIFLIWSEKEVSYFIFSYQVVFQFFSTSPGWKTPDPSLDRFWFIQAI